MYKLYIVQAYGGTSALTHETPPPLYPNKNTYPFMCPKIIPKVKN